MSEERSPLLGGPKKDATKWQSVYLLSAGSFFASLAFSLLNVPMTQLIEDNICRQYTQGATAGKGFCKNDYVQIDLANLSGYMPVMEAVVSLMTAFPFGVLSDRVGRKPILYLSSAGSILCTVWKLAVLGFPSILPVQYMLAGPIFLVVGGGQAVQIASLNSIISDLVTTSERASSFFILAFGMLAGNAVGPFISSELMNSHSPWVPALLSLCMWPIAISLLSLVPETLSGPKKTTIAEIDRAPLGLEPLTIKSHVSQSFRLYKASLASLRSPSIIIVIAINLIEMPEYFATSQFLTQFISKRFQWSFASAGYLIAMRGIIQMTVLLVTLPLLSRLLLRWQRPNARDLTLARFSAAFAAAGALWMASSQVDVVVAGLALQSLGGGMGPLCRSLALTYVPASETSRLMTLIGIVGTSGSLFGGPAFTWLFGVGLERGGVLVGLPYFGLAGAFILCLVGLLFVRAPLSREEDDADLIGIDDCISVGC